MKKLVFLKIKYHLARILGLLFCLLVACTGGDQPTQLASLTQRDSMFFQLRREKDTNRKEILQQSHIIYAESQLCSQDVSCQASCNRLFDLDLDREDCKTLPSPQVDQLERVMRKFREKKISSLQEIDFFNLKVLLNISPQPVLKIFDTMGLISAGIFLDWIASDWQVAQVFYSEDWDFLFFEVFLKERGVSPINSLKEDVNEKETFAERAWFKQNDFALFWMDAYFSNLCVNVEEKEVDDCMLAQYCLLSESFEADILKEIMDFQKLKLIFERKTRLSVTNFKDFCSEFCLSSASGQFCSSANEKFF